MLRLFVLCFSVGLLAAAPARVLFIGNSYTYYHSMPRMVEELAQAAGQEVEVRAFTRGGASLLELELHPELRGMLAEKWDYVVLQEHSTLGLSTWNGELNVNDPGYFFQGARLLAQRAKAANARVVLFSTWARKKHPEFQPHLDHAYSLAARDLNAVVAPAGRAWAAIREQQPHLELFDPDGTHPSAYGSYLSACVIMRTLFNKPCAGLPGSLRGNPLNVRGQREEGREIDLIALKPDVASALQHAADEAVSDVGVYPPWPGSTLPPGRRPRSEELSGRWRGRVFFYGSPATFELELKPDGDRCAGVWRLNADNGSWSNARRLATCRLTDQGISFTISDPVGGVTELHTVSFLGRELSAVTTFDFRTALRRNGGTWTGRLENSSRSAR